jgi:hypothetical protein
MPYYILEYDFKFLVQSCLYKGVTLTYVITPHINHSLYTFWTKVTHKWVFPQIIEQQNVKKSYNLQLFIEKIGENINTVLTFETI